MDNGVLDGVMAEVSREEKQATENAADARTDRLAARAARRAALAHACTGRGCTHRDHRRDVYHAGWLHEALELTGTPPPLPDDYDDQPVSYHVFTFEDAASLRALR